MMTIVEQYRPGWQWADYPQGTVKLAVTQIGSVLRISGLFPSYASASTPPDLISEFERAPKFTGLPRPDKDSPDIQFLNATSDAKLIAFVARYGPVVATKVDAVRFDVDTETGEPQSPARLTAYQEMQELRDEQLIYSAALRLALEARKKTPQEDQVRPLIQDIAASVRAWDFQWERERSHRQVDPIWKLTHESLERIEGLATLGPGYFSNIDGRIVICELLNSFRGIVFPNPLEVHSSIKYGIRPLLYSILRRQFTVLRDFAVCDNTQCRNFFNVERKGQRFCDERCSLRQRQRNYWKKRGRKLRKKRSKAEEKKNRAIHTYTSKQDH